jgi:glycosyltransferase involved in cell wall biosynthesis
MRTCIISSPVATQSGYGHHAREFISNIIEQKGSEWDIKLLSMPWGNTPFTYPISIDWQKRLIPLPIQQQPDIWVQITVPNEFQPVGKYNIGVTAGTEGDICPKEWIEKINQMQIVIVPSNFTKQTFVNAAEKHKLEITTNIQVISEYFNEEVYSKSNNKIKLSKLNEIYESFCYLSVGHWLQGHMGEDRKNISGTIHTFFETFKNKPKSPGLILKTGGATYSITDRWEIENKINQIRNLFPKTTKLPNVYLLHGDLTDDEMNALYNHPKVKAMISFTKGEGFGRPLLEFSTTGKPIIVPHYSGQADFLKKEYIIALGGGLTQIHPSARNPFLIEEAKWFTPDYDFAKKALKEVYKHYNNFLENSRNQMKFSNENFCKTAIAKKYIKLIELIDKGIEHIPVAQQLQLPKLQLPKLQLPKLNKIENGKTELPKLKLPNLKKV